VFMALALRGGVNKFVLSDINEDLINLWLCIQNDWEEVFEHYAVLWKELNKNDNVGRKKEYFYYVRERYNKDRNPLDFMFIDRTTTNGLIRYNSSGEFNNSFHVTRNGIMPSNLEKVLVFWDKVLSDNDVTFICMDYKDVSGEFLYLDPPYAGTKGMYYGGLDLDEFWGWLRLQNSYVLSFDGISGRDNNVYDVPEDLYDEHILLDSGNSSFKRLFGKNDGAHVRESLYFFNI